MRVGFEPEASKS